MKTIILAASALFALSQLQLQATPVGQAVPYQIGEHSFEGWHVYDDSAEGRRPGVLIVHQWTGLGDYEKQRAKQLAELGYNVFALDIYGAGIRPQPPESGKEAGKYKGNRPLFRERLQAGLEVLLGLPQTDPDKVAALGYCFGGTGVLELARSGADIEGVVSFHGGLDSPTPQDAKNISADILVLHGADDPFVPDAEVDAFKKEMKDAGVDYDFVAYPGAVHSFTMKHAGDDPSTGSAYQAEADTRSWEALLAFLKDVFDEN